VLPVRIPGPVLLATAWLVETAARLTRTRPPFETTGVRYLLTGHAMDNARLLGTGFVLRYAETIPGLLETVAWYERHGWRGFRGGEAVPSPLAVAEA
jgi:hypothetical protein